MKNKKVYMLEWDGDTSDSLCGSGQLEDKIFDNISKAYQEVDRISKMHNYEMREGINYYIREFEVL